MACVHGTSEILICPALSVSRVHVSLFRLFLLEHTASETGGASANVSQSSPMRGTGHGWVVKVCLLQSARLVHRQLCTRRTVECDVFLQNNRRLIVACTALKIDSDQVWAEGSAVRASSLARKLAMTSGEFGRRTHGVLLPKLNCLQAR